MTDSPRDPALATTGLLITGGGMPTAETPADSNSLEPPPDLVEVAAYPSYPAAFEHSVVVLATGHACWLTDDGDRHRVLVEPAAAAHVADQLARYDRESVGWPPAPPVDVAASRPIEVMTPLLWALVVLAVFRLQAEHPAWRDRGALDPVAIFGGGEWWRTGTALFLHASAEHVSANVLGGLLAFTALLTTTGRRRGWLLLAAASVLGNLAIAALNLGRDYRSLGASTAIFAALGLLTGRAVRTALRLRPQPHRWRALFMPLAAGGTVLALYGAGTGNIDVPAHAAGFVAGTVLGFVAAARQ